jgi:hypothetical protein
MRRPHPQLLLPLTHTNNNRRHTHTYSTAIQSTQYLQYKQYRLTYAAQGVAPRHSGPPLRGGSRVSWWSQYWHVRA